MAGYSYRPSGNNNTGATILLRAARNMQRTERRTESVPSNARGVTDSRASGRDSAAHNTVRFGSCRKRILPPTAPAPLVLGYRRRWCAPRVGSRRVHDASPRVVAVELAPAVGGGCRGVVLRRYHRVYRPSAAVRLVGKPGEVQAVDRILSRVIVGIERAARNWVPGREAPEVLCFRCRNSARVASRSVRRNAASRIVSNRNGNRMQRLSPAPITSAVTAETMLITGSKSLVEVKSLGWLDRCPSLLLRRMLRPHREELGGTFMGSCLLQAALFVAIAAIMHAPGAVTPRPKTHRMQHLRTRFNELKSWEILWKLVPASRSPARYL